METYKVVASRVVDTAPERENVWQSEMRVWGSKTVFRLTVTQVEPGRVFTEVDEADGASTVWTLTPVDGGRRCEVTLATTYRVKPGVAGWLERLIVQRVTPGIYGRELANIAAYVRA